MPRHLDTFDHVAILEVDFDSAVEFFDRGSIERGVGYVGSGRVQFLSSPPDHVRATCRGSGREAYLVDVAWYRDELGGEITSECTCPVEIDCKHGVAVFLEAQAEARAALGAAYEGVVGPDGAADLGSFGAPLRGDWRNVLGDPDEASSVAMVPMALQFAVKQPQPTRWDPHPSPHLTARPLRLGTSGKWVKSGATWSDVASGYHWELRNADPDHLAVLRALRTTTGVGYYQPGADVDLNDLGSGMWTELSRARTLGLAFVEADHRSAVALSEEPARPRVSLSAVPHGVAVAVEFLIGDDEVPPEFHTIGKVPHGLWFRRDDELHLVPLAVPLSPMLARLHEAGRFVVPEEDVDEFLDRYGESLTVHATIHSPDDSVSIASSELEAIVLKVGRTDLTTATVSWVARYRRGNRRTDRVLPTYDDRGRDLDAEREVIVGLHDALSTHPVLLAPDGSPRPHAVAGLDLIELLEFAVPALEERGVVVETTDDLPPLQEASNGPEIAISVVEGTRKRDGTDWFDLDVTVTVDGQDVPFPVLFAALDHGDEILALPSGTWLRLDQPELEQLRSLLVEARGLSKPNGDHAARVNRFQASWWDELAKLGIVDAQSSRWMQSVAALRELERPVGVDVPPNLKAELRPYQKEGLDWLAFLHAGRLGGILADDMGLGKTLQTLALCLHVKERSPDARFLVVAPTSVVENWAREAERFAPDLDVRTVTETVKRRGATLVDTIGDADVVVTSYTLFRLEFDDYDALDWEVLLLDEAQFVKNHQGKTHQCARRLDAVTKIAITGTPLENSLMDLWSLLSVTAPGLYPDPKRFSTTYRKPIESGDAPELLSTLQRRVAPLMRRRTKDEVLTELPPKIEQTVEVELDKRHARIYDTQLQRQRQKILGLVGDVDANRFEILKSLTLLRQLALDPALIDEEHDAVGSAKIDRLVEDLTQVVGEGHRALVFSQFTRFLGRIRDRLDEAGIAYAYLDGKTRNRKAAIAEFKDGDVPVFLISLKAGGFGLNLTEADYCFVMDPWWNPAVEAQAVDRAHRIGQERSVIVYRYVSANTIEEKVMELKAKKAALFDSVVDADGALSGALTESDIRGLFDV